jgi:hypothetical protein
MNEKHHAELRKFLAVSAARARIRAGWSRDAAINTGARLHGLPVARVEPLVIEAEEACYLTRQRIAFTTSRENWQPGENHAPV